MTQDTQKDTVTAATMAVIDKFNAAWNRKDLDAVMAMMTDTCIFENTYPAPDGTRHVGSEAVRAAFAEFFRSSPQARFACVDQFAGGDRGTARWVYHWVDEAGQPGHIQGVDVFRVQNGKVAEKLSYVKG